MTKSKKAASLGLCLLTVMSTAYAATQSTMPVSASYYASICEDAAEEDEIISVLEELEDYDSYSFWTRPENQTAENPNLWHTSLPKTDPDSWWTRQTQSVIETLWDEPYEFDNVSNTSAQTNAVNTEIENVVNNSMTVSKGLFGIAADGEYNTASTAKKKKETKELHLNVYDVSEPSNLTVDHIKDFIANYTQWTGLEEYLISRDDDINLIFLLAVARTETGGGAKCVGNYNCFNIKDGKGHYRDYNSYEESIDHFIRLINTHYIDPDGKYYNGTSIYDIAKNYASDYWGTYVANLAQDLLEDFENVKV